MTALNAELLKLKRSMIWSVVVVLPVAVVLAGAATQLSRGEAPEDGWHTVWLQSVVFYGLFPLAVGIAILGSLAWRAEHRGSNWNALMSGPTSSRKIIVAKAAVVVGLTAVMQVVLLGSVVVIGKVAFGLPGMLPASYVATTGLLVIATAPVAILQSGVSMLLRSFAGPIAVALVASGVSVATLMLGLDAAIASPYGLATRTTQLGTGTFVDPGSVTGADVVAVLVIAVVASVLLIAASAAVLDRRDTRI